MRSIARPSNREGCAVWGVQSTNQPLDSRSSWKELWYVHSPISSGVALTVKIARPALPVVPKSTASMTVDSIRSCDHRLPCPSAAWSADAGPT